MTTTQNKYRWVVLAVAALCLGLGLQVPTASGASPDRSVVQPGVCGPASAWPAADCGSALRSRFRGCGRFNGYDPKRGRWGLILSKLKVRGVSCRRAARIGGKYHARERLPRGWRCWPAPAGATYCYRKGTRKALRFYFDGTTG